MFLENNSLYIIIYTYILDWGTNFEFLNWQHVILVQQNMKEVLHTFDRDTTVTTVSILMKCRLFKNEEQKFLGCIFKEVFISSVSWM